MKNLKILLIGPSKSGKSTIANFLSEAIDYNIDNYRPTPGVRILEYEIRHNNRTTVEVELWDCSGDESYEPFWPVFSWNTQGVVIVFNPEDSKQFSEVERLYENFVLKNMISNNNALLIANCKDPGIKSPVPDLHGPVTNLNYVNINIMQNGEDLKSAFETYVSDMSTGGVRDYDLDDLGLLT